MRLFIFLFLSGLFFSNPGMSYGDKCFKTFDNLTFKDWCSNYYQLPEKSKMAVNLLLIKVEEESCTSEAIRKVERLTTFSLRDNFYQRYPAGERPQMSPLCDFTFEEAYDPADEDIDEDVHKCDFDNSNGKHYDLRILWTLPRLEKVYTTRYNKVVMSVLKKIEDVKIVFEEYPT